MVSSGGKITFGFRRINGKAVDLKIVNQPRGTFVDKFTLPTLRNRVVAVMNKHGRRAEVIAKSPTHSPFLSGALVGSIKWVPARRKGFGGRVILGQLGVGVKYGRRQEFEHKTKAFYLHRALQQVFPGFIQELRDQGAINDILIGKRKFR